MCVKESPRLLARQEREREREREREKENKRDRGQARAPESGREVPSSYSVRACCLCTQVSLLSFSHRVCLLQCGAVCTSVLLCDAVCCRV